MAASSTQLPLHPCFIGRCSPVQSGGFNAVAVPGTSSNEGIEGAAVGLEGHVEHDAEEAQGPGDLGHVGQGADEGVEGGLLHGPMLAGQRLHQLYRLIHPASTNQEISMYNMIDTMTIVVDVMMTIKQ